MTTAKKAPAKKTDIASTAVTAPATPPSGIRKVADPATNKPTVVAPSHDQIAARAFAIFQDRGAEHGRALEDWIRAERELTQN